MQQKTNLNQQLHGLAAI